MTTITLPRTTIEQAIDAMRDAAYDEEGYTLNADLAEAHDDLFAALEQPQQDEPAPVPRQELPLYAALLAEASRYQWLKDNCLAFDAVSDPDDLVQVWHGTDPARCTYGKTLDAAIDAAMRGKEQL